MVLTIGLILALSVGAGGCKKASPPDDSLAGQGEGAGDTGGESGGETGLGEPGDGLPVTLPSGVVAFGLHTFKDGWEEKMVLATVDLEGQGLTRHFALSPYERELVLSPDGVKLATLNGGQCNYDADLIFWVYDLAAGTLTKLPRPVAEAYPGYPATFCWSPDSSFITYTCMLVGTENGDRLVRVPIDGSASAFVEAGDLQAFQAGLMAAVPGKDAVAFTNDSSTEGFSLHVYDFGTDQTTTVLNSGVESDLAISVDGRYAAFRGFQRYGALGMAWENPLVILDLASGQKTEVPGGTDLNVVDLFWSPAGSLLAIVWEDSSTYPAHLGVTVYDQASGTVRFTTAPIDTISYSCDPVAVWTPDGATLLVAGGPSAEVLASMNLPPAGASTIYRIDVASGEFRSIFTTEGSDGIRGLVITP